MDIVTANSGSNSISVLLGQGDGTLKRQLSYQTGKTPLFLVAGDWNGDGKTDIAVTNSGDNALGIFLGANSQ